MNFISWKGNSTYSFVPTNSRPFINGSINFIPENRTNFKANPIKHWRKQLKPTYKTNSKQISIQSIDAPTTKNYVKSISNTDCSNNIQLLQENISILNGCNGIQTNTLNGNQSCIGGSNHITRSANTNLKRNYHVSHSKYLQSKCKTYERNLVLGEKINDYTYKSTDCTQKCYDNSEYKPIIYKPSNIRFRTQGAVSASLVTKKNKNNALNKNSNSLQTAYGNAPIFIRNYYPGTTGYEIYYVKGNTEDRSQQCRQTFKSCY